MTFPHAPRRDEPSNPFWTDGLAFSCRGPKCTDCCTGKHGPGYVWVSESEAARLAETLGLDEARFRATYTRSVEGRTSLRERWNHDCVFLEPELGCTVYDARPSQCRSYPFWPRILADANAWRDEATRCPGIALDGSGPRVPADLVDAALRSRAFPV